MKPQMHPDLVRKINLVIQVMAEQGMIMTITPNPVRTAEMQNALYQIGRTKPGKIVTNADGYKTKSNHQVHEDGYGHAVDCHFIVKGKHTWDVPQKWWYTYGEVCRMVGLKWGIKIGTWIDNPHTELEKK